MIENSQAIVNNAKLSKKRKLASDLNVSKSNFQVPKQCAEDKLEDQALTSVKMFAKTKLQSEPQVTIETTPDHFDGEKLTTKETNSNEQQKDWRQSTSEPVQKLSNGNGKHPMDWWKMSNRTFYISSKIANNVNENDSSFSCVECGKDPIVVTTCCDEPS